MKPNPQEHWVHTFIQAQSGEVARVEVCEESADVRKEPFVREEVNVRKETEQDIVSEEATVRREELDIDTDGTNVVRR